MLRTDVGSAVHAEGFPLGHVVVHHTKDTLFHFSCVAGSKDDLLLRSEVDVDGVFALDVGELVVGAELTGVDDSEVGAILEVLLDLLVRRANQHLLHEKGVVGSGRDNTGLESVFGVPPSVLINYKDLHKHEGNKIHELADLPSCAC